MEYIEQLGVNAKAAEPLVSSMGTNEKNRALAAISEALRTHVTEIIGANQLDIENARKNGMSEAMIDRLTLTEARIEGMAEGVDKVISLPDPSALSSAEATFPTDSTSSRSASPSEPSGSYLSRARMSRWTPLRSASRQAMQ